MKDIIMKEGKGTDPLCPWGISPSMGRMAMRGVVLFKVTQKSWKEKYSFEKFSVLSVLSV